MSFKTEDKLVGLHYKNIECSKMSDSEINATSVLFSNNYGTWSSNHPNEEKRGKKILFSNEMIRREFVEKKDRYVALAYYNQELIGHIFYMRREIQKNKAVMWVLQLVVSEKYRGYGIGTKMLHSVWRLSDCYAWGLYTSNPMTIKALERATRRRINVAKIAERIDFLKEVSCDIFKDSEWIESYHNGSVNTKFYVDHSALASHIKQYGEKEFVFDKDLPEGREWLAFVFKDQKPYLTSLEDLQELMDFSEETVKYAYSRMHMEKQGWTQNASNEVDFFIKKGYILPSDKVLDVGCGFGRHTAELNERGICTFGVDFSEDNIKKAKEKYNPDWFECCDIRAFKPKEKYDVIICLYDVVGSFPDENDNFNVLKSINKLLKPGGRILISVMNMSLTRSRCRKVVKNIDNNIDALLKLEGSDTMQETGNVFDGKKMLLDEKTGIVYRKEQFFDSDALPTEYIVRDRRYTRTGLQNFLTKAGFIVESIHCFNSGKIQNLVSETKGKEIFACAQKAPRIQRLAMKFVKNGYYWK